MLTMLHANWNLTTTSNACSRLGSVAGSGRCNTRRVASAANEASCEVICNAMCSIVYLIVYHSLSHHLSGAIYKIAPSHAFAVKSDPIFLPSTSKQCPCMCGVSAASKMRSYS